MSFDWSYNLKVARELGEQAKNATYPLQEARYRASISRAYYAAFGKARYHLRHYDKIQEPYQPCNSQGERITNHRYVIETFKSLDEGHKNIGDILNSMLAIRNQADYEYNDRISRNLPYSVKVTLDWAKEAMDTLDSLPKK